MPSKMLVPVNPAAPKNITVYSFKERKFVTDELVDQLVFHFIWEGFYLIYFEIFIHNFFFCRDCILKDQNEAKIQEEIQDTRASLVIIFFIKKIQNSIYNLIIYFLFKL